MRRTGVMCILLMICLLTGCIVLPPQETLGEIKGDIECEFRVGKNAKTQGTAVDTGVVFDKDEFVKLYNEDCKYDPNHIKYHLDECDLKINASEQPDEWEKIFSSEVNVRATFEGKTRHVSVYRYDSKLYFFVLCMGSRSKAEEVGYYYMELPDEMAEYWSGIFEEALK